MTDFRIETFPFSQGALPRAEEELRDWPVVYVLSGDKHAYVGETHNAINRMAQHLQIEERRKKLKVARVVVDETFNKSACHDLEAFLIKYLDGDDRFELMNKVAGQSNYNYYNRAA